MKRERERHVTLTDTRGYSKPESAKFLSVAPFLPTHVPILPEEYEQQRVLLLLEEPRQIV